MPAGVLSVIAIISALLPIMQQGVELLNKVKNEDRDITAEELAALRSQTDALYNQVMSELAAAAKETE